MGQKGISHSVRRKDAIIKARGELQYLSDIYPNPECYGRFFYSDKPRGKIIKRELPDLPEGYYIFGHEDVPGSNQIQMINNDWPVFASHEVRYIGQIIYLVVGPDKDIILDILSKIRVDIEETLPCYNIDESIKGRGGYQHKEDNVFARYTINHGAVDKAFNQADRVVEKQYFTGYQEHAYMEPQSLLADWRDNKLFLHASAQCPFYIRHSIESVLGLGSDDIRVVQAPTGGAFGGKEHFPDVLATPLAVAAYHIKKSIKLVLDRKEDLSYSVKRHPSATTIQTALDKEGNILAHKIEMNLDGGAYESCSAIVLQRGILTLGNVYNIDNILIEGKAYCTNKPPSCAFRGFGAPQAVFAIESHMNFLASELGVDPIDLREKYLFQKGDPTTTDGSIQENVILPQMIERALEISDYRKKYEAYKTEPLKGIGFSAFLHGCGFTGNGERVIIKGKVRLEKSSDGEVLIHAANVEMGQGLSTTFCKVAAQALDIPLEKVHYHQPDTTIVPDSGPTVASRSISVVGFLVQKAAEKLKEQWKEGEAQEVIQHYESPPCLESWDQEAFKGNAYPAYSWGINIVEVEVDPITYEVDTKGIWGVYDIGVPIDSLIVEGQIIGGMIQALGYSGLEKLECDNGRFKQKTMADYMIPTSMDFPMMHSETIDNPFEYGAFGAKGAGEMVFNGAGPAYSAAVSQAVDRVIDELPVLPETLMELTDEER